VLILVICQDEPNYAMLAPWPDHEELISD